MAPVLVFVSLNISVIRTRDVDLNVLQMQIVIVQKHVQITNVKIHVLEHVALMQNVKFWTTRLRAVVYRDTLVIRWAYVMLYP